MKHDASQATLKSLVSGTTILVMKQDMGQACFQLRLSDPLSFKGGGGVQEKLIVTGNLTGLPYTAH
jgi:hypothetical protein